ncbi:MAG: hypothetical protein Q8Q17_01150 [bacterium]|nr:hypothetical protein [bacterium]
MAEIKGDNIPEKGELSQELKDLIDIEIARYGLSADASHSLFSLMPFLKTKIEDIAPLQAYEEYFRDKTYGDYIMSKSDPTIVEEWNSKIRAFNDDLERIKREKDEQKVKAFYDEMMAFLR